MEFQDLSKDKAVSVGECNAYNAYMGRHDDTFDGFDGAEKSYAANVLDTIDECFAELNPSSVGDRWRCDYRLNIMQAKRIAMDTYDAEMATYREKVRDDSVAVAVSRDEWLEVFEVCEEVCIELDSLSEDADVVRESEIGHMREVLANFATSIGRQVEGVTE